MIAFTANATSIDNCEKDQTLDSQRSNLREADAHGERMTIGEFAREEGVTLRALRFYQSKGLLAPDRAGHARIYGQADRERLVVVLQGKRLGFTLSEFREMLAGQVRGTAAPLSISRKKCVEQINLLERQRRDIELALSELRQIYTAMFEGVLRARSA
jgi:DNA-binding transcriptional MerR regulator